MSTNRISTSIPPEVVAQAKESLTAIKTLLQPYLQSLSTEERRDMLKMSDKTFSFVSKISDYCVTNNEFCPSYMDVEEFGKDFAVTATLRPLLDLCEQLCSNIDDTIMLAGSEAFSSGLMYYSSVQAAAKTGQMNAKPIFEELRQRFVRRKPAIEAVAE